MTTYLRLLIPVALLQVLACSDAVEQPAENGAGGSPPGETTSSSVSGGAGGGPETSSSTSGGAGGGPVACAQGEGAPPGAACEEEGEICDFACSGCWVACTDGVWVEECTMCPDELPEDGSDCSGKEYVGPCSYVSECGTATAECDGSTGLWVVEGTVCGPVGCG